MNMNKLSSFFISSAFFLYLATAALSCKKDSPSYSIGGEVNPPGTETAPSPVQETAVAFPGAEGYGKIATGGRGGKVIKVTNLNDAGAGSLREAIDAKGPRIVVFEVDGNIVLNSRLELKNGDITIAGQTAPGDGICIQNYEMNVSADNVIIRFLRFRMGDLTKNENDALWGRYKERIIIDHCSMSWSIDECSSFYANKDFTMQYCLLAESLNKSFHEKDDHGYAAIWGGVNASFHHNLLAHHGSRNPRFDGGNRSGTGLSPKGTDKVDYRNNVIYNWRSNTAYGGENGQYNMVANYYKPGPGTVSSVNRRLFQAYMAPEAQYAPGYPKLFLTGNVVTGNAAVTAANWSGVNYQTGATELLVKLNAPIAFEAITEQSAELAYVRVLELAGASYKRDAVDTRIVGEVENGTATYSGSKTGYRGIIDSQTDVGGWPVLKTGSVLKDTDGDGMPDDWEVANKLDPKVANASGRNLSTGYDNIEVYMNSLVKTITDKQLAK